jgi:nucleotide-binding universal stress UspA family protein
MTSMTIAHATGLTPEEQPVFEHALAIACAAHAKLFSVNAVDAAGAHTAPPDAAKILAGWGRAGDCVDHEAMIHSCCEDPIDTLLDALGRVAPDLIVAGTHQRSTASRLLSGSQCEALLRNVTRPTLVFPLGAKTFVSEDGRFELTRMLIPVGDADAARAALERAAWLAEITNTEQLTIELLFVGDDDEAPPVEMPRRPGWTVQMTTAHGRVADSVVDAARDSCVIVMATRGPDSLKDTLLGTNTEQVLRHAKCPVLITPVA